MNVTNFQDMKFIKINLLMGWICICTYLLYEMYMLIRNVSSLQIVLINKHSQPIKYPYNKLAIIYRKVCYIENKI